MIVCYISEGLSLMDVADNDDLTRLNCKDNDDYDNDDDDDDNGGYDDFGTMMLMFFMMI